MKNITIILLLLLTNITFAKIKIFDTNKEKYIEFQEMIQEIPANSNVVLGEYHYQKSIQLMQGKIIQQVVKYHNAQKQFSVGWEFLNFYENTFIQPLIGQYKNGLLSDKNLIDELFMGTNNSNNYLYLPIFQTIKELDGDFYGLNVGRNIRAKVVKEGIDSINQSMVPANYKLGSDLYFTRFKEAMGGGHTPDHLILPYFTAQSLTDSVMAYHLLENSKHNLTFTVVGSFHSDYFLGYIGQLSALSGYKIINIKIVETSDLSDSEINQLVTPSPIYGKIADYIVFTK